MSSVTVAQIRAARALIGWSQDELAASAGLSRLTVSRAETVGASATSLIAMQEALEKAGIIFVPENGEGHGVRLRKKND